MEEDAEEGVEEGVDLEACVMEAGERTVNNLVEAAGGGGRGRGGGSGGRRFSRKV